ncbi:MAG: C4-type zinc ribbon domain-containing protein [Bifidobacteriaceae bacterium]|nr:C4-type zinc ribbon domain-containing protein [Bifidobacteriaceae bacterium]
MKAPAADQTTLLQVQAHDTALHQLGHKRNRLPELAQLTAVRQELTGLREDVEEAKLAAAEVRRDLTRVEDEMTKVEERRQRDQERLDSGGGTSRELVSLQQEIEVLVRRHGVLEEAALEQMELAEQAQARQSELESKVAQLTQQETELESALAVQMAEIDAAAAQEKTLRDQLATGLDAGLLQLYQRLRERLGGVGAAALVQRRCEGCGIDLNASDLSAIRKLEPDDVARCEECTRILVRGEDSGL